MSYALRSALRALARRRGLAITVVATLTLGIGANSAIFSAVDAVLLKPLPYPAADRLVALYESSVARRQSTALVAPVRLEEWNTMNHSFDGLAASYFEKALRVPGVHPLVRRFYAEMYNRAGDKRTSLKEWLEIRRSNGRRHQRRLLGTALQP